MSSRISFLSPSLSFFPLTFFSHSISDKTHFTLNLILILLRLVLLTYRPEVVFSSVALIFEVLPSSLLRHRLHLTVIYVFECASHKYANNIIVMVYPFPSSNKKPQNAKQSTHMYSDYIQKNSSCTSTDVSKSNRLSRTTYI